MKSSFYMILPQSALGITAIAWPAMKTQEFISSLTLSTDAEERVAHILMQSPEVEGESVEVEKVMALSLRLQLGCLLFKAIFGSRALTEESAIGDAVAESWSKTCWVSPKCVIRPKKNDHVSQALKTINFLQLPFAIRSGGHSPNPGWSSVKDGILIDLSSMNEIKISEDSLTVSVDPGVRWGEVYEFLDPYAVTVVGGRVPEVGVGGLLLGGGLSYLSGEYGLAVDNIVNIEVVLANGDIVNSNKEMRKDLFWALKGGGPNFGVVTRYDLQTVPIRQIWYKMMLFSPEKIYDVFEAFAEWQSSPDTKASVGMVATTTSVAVGLVYLEPVETPVVFQPFYNIEPLATPIPSQIGTVLSLSQISGLGMATPTRHDYRGISSKIDPELYKEAFSTWKDQAIIAGEVAGANMTFVLQHIPRNLVEAGRKNGGNALGLDSMSQQCEFTN